MLHVCRAFVHSACREAATQNYPRLVTKPNFRRTSSRSRSISSSETCCGKLVINDEDVFLVFFRVCVRAPVFGLLEAKTAGKPIPGDVAYDKDGNSTTDPAAALQGAIRVFDRCDIPACNDGSYPVAGLIFLLGESTSIATACSLTHYAPRQCNMLIFL